ncbi:MAG: sulfur carrier protein ThiS [Myxococcales bacterium]|nr:sulfur carrier protein ThiS [Myxococcales bacterium]
MASLHLQVNGEAFEVPSGSTVESLLGRLGMRERRLAVAINRDVVPRSGYSVHELHAGDRVEILEAVGGG